MILFKLGGRVLENLLNANCPLRGWNRIQEKFVVLHGGGALINSMAESLGIKSEFVGGQRVTSPEMLDVVEMVLRGRMNPELVRVLQNENLPTWGLSSSDMKILNCELEDSQLGLVGRVQSVNTKPIELLLDNGFVPVLAPLGYYRSADREVVNVNADMAAAQVACALSARKLVFFTDRDGILDENNQRIACLTYEELQKMRDSKGNIQGGMLIKTRGVLEFLASQKNAEVWVINGLRPIDLDQFIELGSSEFGTKITLNS